MELSNETFLHGAKYKILSKISQGNFGITYLAEQTSLDRKVCIKEFFFRGFCERNSDGSVTISTSGQQVANSFRHKFMREAKRLSQFDHPNIVKVIDVFEENGTAYMVMDYLEGETLQQLVDRKGKLSEKEALEYIIPLCDALDVVHEKGLLHLDIKPSNILIKRQTNTPVLIDFGISKFTEASGDDHSTTTPVALTKGYAPLEQYGQDLAKLTVSTDVYSVAATLYKLVTGVTPPEAAVIVQDGVKSPKELNPILSEQLSSIVLQSLSYIPNHRAQSISKLKADLMGISESIVERETEVLFYDGEDDKNIPIVVQVTDKDTEPKNKNSMILWLALIAFIIIVIVVKNNNPAPNSENEARITGTAVNNTQSQYDIVSTYSDGLAAVKKDNKWGYIDNFKMLVIPLLYDDASPFLDGKTTVKLNGTWIEIDKKGNEINRVIKNNQPIIINDNISSQETTSRQTIIYENPVTDIDGNVYKTVRIGNQVWMAENLRVTHYRNGDPIPKVIDNHEWVEVTTGAYCYYNNDSANGLIYGCLYNGFAVSDFRNITPIGWHIPSKKEWEKLAKFLGGAKVAGGKLREIGNQHWPKPINGLKVNATNSVGFNALPSGCRYYGTGSREGEFGSEGSFYSWTSTELDEKILFETSIHFNFEDLHFSDSLKQLGFSLRCVKDI